MREQFPPQKRRGAGPANVKTHLLHSHATPNKEADIPVCTAQGGSGSFKDRKPIGEVRCCESWMAEQIH